MRLRDILPRAGWTMIAFAGLGAGATVALVTDVSGRSSSAEAANAAAAIVHDDGDGEVAG